MSGAARARGVQAGVRCFEGTGDLAAAMAAAGLAAADPARAERGVARAWVLGLHEGLRAWAGEQETAR